MMKKRTCILLMILVALPLAVLFLGKKTIYLPVRTEVYFSSTERDEYLQAEIDYKYTWYGFLDKMKYKTVNGLHTLDVNCNTIGNVAAYEGCIKVSPDALALLNETYTYRWDGKILISTSDDDSFERTYDFWGRLVCAKRIRGQYTVMMRYNYDASGKLISGNFYRVNGDTETLYATNQITYNQNAKKLAETHYDSKGEVLRQVNYRYENKKTIVDVDRSLSSETLTFDHAGNLIEKYTCSDSYSSRTTYVHTYKAVRIPFWFPRREFVYTSTLPSQGFFNWYDRSNVDP